MGVHRDLIPIPERRLVNLDEAHIATLFEAAHADDWLTVVEDFDRDAEGLAHDYRTLAAHGSALLLGLN